jgi:MFS family permease
MERKAVRAFVILKILEGACLGFIATTYVPFLQSRGLSLFQSTQVNVAFMLAMALLDPLTGSLGDKIGQKKTYILGFFFVGVGTFVYGSGHGFWTFVLAESISAIGTALWSKALESWIRTLYGKEVCHQAISKGGYYSRIFSIAIGFVGSLAAANYGLQIPWFIGSVVSFSSIAAGLLITKSFPDSTKDEDRGSIRDAIRLVVGVPELRFTAVVSCVLSLSFQALNMFWSPTFEMLIGSLRWHGFIWAGIAIFSFTGFYLVRKMTNPNKAAVGISVYLTGVPVLVAALFFSNNLWALLAGFLLHEVGRAAVISLIFTYSNDFIPDKIRATVNSVFGSMGTVGAIIGLLGSGFLTEYRTTAQVWAVSGCVLLALSTWILLTRKRK